MPSLTAAGRAYQNWTSAVRRATPWAHEWKLKDEEQLRGKGELPNARLRAQFDVYKKSNFGNAPTLFSGTVRGRQLYVFSLGHGVGSPATVFIHDASGRLIRGAGN